MIDMAAIGGPSQPDARWTGAAVALAGFMARLKGTHNALETASMELADKPKATPQGRRESAIGIFTWKYVDTEHTPEQIAAMQDELEAMKKLGRTDRWRGSLETMRSLLVTEKDTDWVIRQYGWYVGMDA